MLQPDGFLAEEARDPPSLQVRHGRMVVIPQQLDVFETDARRNKSITSNGLWNLEVIASYPGASLPWRDVRAAGSIHPKPGFQVFGYGVS